MLLVKYCQRTARGGYCSCCPYAYCGTQEPSSTYFYRLRLCGMNINS